MKLAADHRCRKYALRGIHRVGYIYLQVIGFAGILFFTVSAVWVLVAGLPHYLTTSTNLFEDPRVTLICLCVWAVVVSWMVGSAIMNAQPNFWAVESGIYVSVFALFRMFIPWSEIIDIIDDRPWKGYALVRARKITPFHWMIGWIYSRTLRPGVLIGPGIENREELLRIIRRRSINGIIPPSG